MTGSRFRNLLQLLIGRLRYPPVLVHELLNGASVQWIDNGMSENLALSADNIDIGFNRIFQYLRHLHKVDGMACRLLQQPV